NAGASWARDTQDRATTTPQSATAWTRRADRGRVGTAWDLRRRRFTSDLRRPGRQWGERSDLPTSPHRERDRPHGPHAGRPGQPPARLGQRPRDAGDADDLAARAVVRAGPGFPAAAVEAPHLAQYQRSSHR